MADEPRTLSDEEIGTVSTEERERFAVADTDQDDQDDTDDTDADDADVGPADSAS
jgi:hypothetical protein